MKPRALLAAALAVCLSACSSARIAGGALVTPGDEPEGQELAEYRTEHCHDAKGQALVEIDARVKLVRRKDRKLVIVDTRLGYDTVVGDNGAVHGDTLIFDVALKKMHGKPYVRQYRFPLKTRGDGHYVLSSRFEDQGTDSGFSAKVTASALECTLTLQT